MQHNGSMYEVRVILGKGGRIHLPARHRRALGFEEGEEVLVGIHDGAIRIETQNGALERARRLVRRIYAAEADAAGGGSEAGEEGLTEGFLVEEDPLEEDPVEEDDVFRGAEGSWGSGRRG